MHALRIEHEGGESTEESLAHRVAILFAIHEPLDFLGVLTPHFHFGKQVRVSSADLMPPESYNQEISPSMHRVAAGRRAILTRELVGFWPGKGEPSASILDAHMTVEIRYYPPRGKKYQRAANLIRKNIRLCFRSGCAIYSVMDQFTKKFMIRSSSIEAYSQ